MANVTTYKRGFIEITGLDDDWHYTTEMAALKTAGRYPKRHVDYYGGLRLQGIVFKPSAANDVMVIHEEGLDTTPIFDVKVAGATDTRKEYLDGKLCRPTIDISDCTLGTPANASVRFILMDPK